MKRVWKDLKSGEEWPQWFARLIGLLVYKGKPIKITKIICELEYAKLH